MTARKILKSPETAQMIRMTTRIRPALLLGLALTAMAPNALGQIPGLPVVPTKVEVPKKDDAPAPTPENPQATVAEASGPIKVENKVADHVIEAFLGRVLPQYPGVRSIETSVENGVVTLNGQVDDADTRDRIRDIVRRVEGVVVVLNKLKTDTQVMTAPQLVVQHASNLWGIIHKKWLLAAVALAIALGGLTLGRAFAKYSDALLSPFVDNGLLRSVLGSVLAGLLGIGGFILALNALELTQAVLSIVGFASIVGLAIGFAFRDIAENFIASVLLGIRRPFRIGDYVEVAGRAGLIKALNTRATVLVTLEGNHVRIPNSVIFKEIMTNHSASPSVRKTFDVLVPFEASTAAALDAVTSSVQGHDGILDDPAPRALVEELRPQGVLIRAYFWTPSAGVDGLKLMSDAKLRAKVALQKANVNLAMGSNVSVAVAGKVPVLLGRAETNGQAGHLASPVAPVVTVAQAKLNLHRDARAADAATQATAEASASAKAETPAEQVMDAPENAVSDEGTNLLKAS